MVHPEKTNSGGPISGPLVGQTVVPNKETSSGGPLGGPFRGKSMLMMAKSRVTPINGTTVSRAEMQSLTMLTRGLLMIAKTMPDKPEQAIICGDSECSIAALEKTGGVLGPYFANRVSEIQENISQLEELVDIVEPVQHIAGDLNPADLGTRGHATLEELDKDSIWQNGPRFLENLERNEWPISRQFRDCVPQTELRSKHEVTLKVGLVGTRTVESMELLKRLVDASLKTNDWRKSQGVLARLLRASCCKDEDRRGY